jgi:hypothetical protein
MREMEAHQTMNCYQKTLSLVVRERLSGDKKNAALLAAGKMI